MNTSLGVAHRAADRYNALLASPWPIFLEQLKSKGVFVSEAKIKTQIIRENFNQIYDSSSMTPTYNRIFAYKHVNAMYAALQRLFASGTATKRRDFAKRLLVVAEKSLTMQVAFSDVERNDFCARVGELILLLEMIIRSPLCISFPTYGAEKSG